MVPAAPAEGDWRRDPGARCRAGHGRPRRQGLARRAFEDDDAAELDLLAGFEPDAVEQDLDCDDACVGLADERERMARGVGRTEQALGMYEHRVGGHHLARMVAVSEHLASEPPGSIRTDWTGVVATRRAHGRPRLPPVLEQRVHHQVGRERDPVDHQRHRARPLQRHHDAVVRGLHLDRYLTD